MRLCVGAFLSVLLPVASAAEADSWMQLGAVDRSNVYTVVLRDRTCDQGLILKLDQSSVVIEGRSSTISRDRVLRVGEGTDLHEILFSGRSSWADALACTVGPRERLRILLKSGQHLDVIPTGQSASELGYKSGGKDVAVQKSDVSKVLYVRYKPLSANYRYVAQEAPLLALFSPKTWQYGLKIDATMSVLLYDSSTPEDDSPVTCSAP